MTTFLCIGCGLDAGKRCWRYCGESVCLKCGKNVLYYTLQDYRWAHDIWRSIERADARGERVIFINAAIRMAGAWAKVREELQVTPFPAGLRAFLKEMNW